MLTYCLYPLIFLAGQYPKAFKKLLQMQLQHVHTLLLAYDNETNPLCDLHQLFKIDQLDYLQPHFLWRALLQSK